MWNVTYFSSQQNLICLLLGLYVYEESLASFKSNRDIQCKNEEGGSDAFYEIYYYSATIFSTFCSRHFTIHNKAIIDYVHINLL